MTFSRIFQSTVEERFSGTSAKKFAEIQCLFSGLKVYIGCTRIYESTNLCDFCVGVISYMGLVVQELSEIFETIREIIGHGTKVHVEDRPHNDKRYAVDSEALKNLGWSEQVPFDVAIQKTVEWYMTNRTWYLK